MATILGIGGLFFKAKRPKQLGTWYAKWLGLKVAPWGGVVFPAKSIPKKGYTVWSPFAVSTSYFRPSRKGFMLNLMVDDLEGMLGRVGRSGAKVMKKGEESEYGRFGWFIDPEATKSNCGSRRSERPGRFK